MLARVPNCVLVEFASALVAHFHFSPLLSLPSPVANAIFPAAAEESAEAAMRKIVVAHITPNIRLQHDGNASPRFGSSKSVENVRDERRQSSWGGGGSGGSGAYGNDGYSNNTYVSSSELDVSLSASGGIPTRGRAQPGYAMPTAAAQRRVLGEKKAKKRAAWRPNGAAVSKSKRRKKPQRGRRTGRRGWHAVSPQAEAAASMLRERGFGGESKHRGHHEGASATAFSPANANAPRVAKLNEALTKVTNVAKGLQVRRSHLHEMLSFFSPFPCSPSPRPPHHPPSLLTHPSHPSHPSHPEHGALARAEDAAPGA